MKFKSDIEVQAGLKDSSGAIGASGQLLSSTGTGVSWTNSTGFVPYTGANQNVDLGIYTLLAAKGVFSSSGSANTVEIGHSSGSGIALNIIKGGNGEGLYINKTSGSGNAATIIGTLNATTLVKSGGTAAQFLKADGTVDSTTYAPTSRTITINGVTQDLSANRSFTVAGGIDALNPTANHLTKFFDSDTIQNSQVFDNGTNVMINGTGNSTFRFSVFESGTSLVGSWINMTSTQSTQNAFQINHYGTGNLIQGFGTGASLNFSVSNSGAVTGNSFIKIGGTADQYLKADGSVSTAMNSRVEVNFTATSGQTTFTTPYEVGQIDVFYNGSKLNLSEFTATNGTTIVLAQAATLNAQVSIVKYVSSFNTTSIRNESIFTATAGQTTFSVNYAVGQVDVFYNGSKLNTSEFTATNGTSVVLGFACQAGESIAIISYVNQVSGAVGTANKVAKFTGVASLGDSQIDDNGTNVSIGYTTNPNTHKLDVNGTGRFSDTVTFNGSNNVVRSGNELRFNRSDNLIFTRLYDAGSFFALDNRNGNGFDFQSAGTSQMRITSGGNVGIGTGVTDPEGKLTVQGISAQPPISGTTANSLLQLKGSLNNELNIGSNTVAGGYGSYIQASDNNLAASYQLNLQPNGGNVIIGGYTDGGYRLDVAGQIRSLSDTPLVLAMSTNPANDAVIASRWTGGTGIEMRYNPNNALCYFDSTYPASGGLAFGDIQFRVNASSTMTPVMTIKANNRSVGIGTTSPVYALDVYNTGASSARVRVIGTDNFSLLQAQNDSGAFYLGIDSSTAGGFAQGNYTRVIYSSNNYPLAISVNNAERMRITSGGTVQINNNQSNGVVGTNFIAYALSSNSFFRLGNNTSNSLDIQLTRSDSATMLSVNGHSGAGFLNSSAWSYGSDRRIKENIVYIETGLEKIMALKPAKFDYINGIKNNIGWIAQDVQNVIPEAVNVVSEDNDQLTLKSDFIIPYLVKAIQEQQAQIKELQDEIISLKNK
jgi:hypothetical protein